MTDRREETRHHSLGAFAAADSDCLLIFSDVLEDELAGRVVDPNQPEPDYASREGPGQPD